MRDRIGSLFIISGLIVLIMGVIIGILISMNYILPEFMKELIPFNRLRPLHTTSVISWIILAASGGVYYYLSQEGLLYSKRLSFVHYVVFACTFACIIVSLLLGQMGGREYLVFSPVLILPILFGWMLFGWNYFKSVLGKIHNWPVYYWMWGTGIIFMIFHLIESNFWMLDHFRQDFIRDMTVQWKSYGSFVGSWNMLVYGTAIYLMAKLKGDESPGRGRLPFFFYFLGLTNLMFGWAHHTYVLPTLPWVRYIAYGISMTEWIIFIRMIYMWSKSLSAKDKSKAGLAYLFLMASDFWVFCNLLMALLMSIPALNLYTHGTHITVAHSMGTTIGINTMILMGSISYIVTNRKMKINGKYITQLFYTVNISLAGFWISLIASGVHKAMVYSNLENVSTSELHASSYAYYVAFILSGVLLGISLMLLSVSFVKSLFRDIFYIAMPTSLQQDWDNAYQN